MRRAELVVDVPIDLSASSTPFKLRQRPKAAAGFVEVAGTVKIDGPSVLVLYLFRMEVGILLVALGDHPVILPEEQGGFAGLLVGLADTPAEGVVVIAPGMRRGVALVVIVIVMNVDKANQPVLAVLLVEMLPTAVFTEAVGNQVAEFVVLKMVVALHQQPVGIYRGAMRLALLRQSHAQQVVGLVKAELPEQDVPERVFRKVCVWFMAGGEAVFQVAGVLAQIQYL